MGHFRKPETPVIVGPLVCTRETDKAILVKFEGKETWVPRSQIIREESEVFEQGDQGILAVSEWIAKQKGWL